ncbi:methylamine utilization protein [Pseudomonas sp. J452]|uniref:methylamine utilization protein n=1 Tax=Pseudomonas sp. J452 TaxID=2898441 RepID=UPI0021AD8EB1|nr:methylamine utilization protein [Pseudomonas sp. J452]UUY08477.1 methylamine utilization protein [Pseudomonas sp. J452]
MGKLGVGLLAGLLWSGWLAAASLDIQVTDKHGGPLADAVLWIEPGAGQAPAAGLKVNQEKRQFVPYILAVQAGTTVSFPNADPINHHVYSFSPAKRFELRLQKQQDLPQDVLFDKPGLVTLGCNIHDWMLGFILVLDSPGSPRPMPRARRASITSRPPGSACMSGIRASPTRPSSRCAHWRLTARCSGA